MKNFRIAAFTLLLATAGLTLAQSTSDTLQVTGTLPGATIDIRITDTSGVDLGAAYDIGALLTDAFRYGTEFLVLTSYTNIPDGGSIALSVSGSTTDYDLAYSHQADGATNPTNGVVFGNIGTAAVSGAATDTFVAGSGATAFNTFGPNNLTATKFRIGAKAHTTASTALDALVTITATVQ